MPTQEILLVRKELQMINGILLALIYRYPVFNKCANFDKKGIFVTPPLCINIYGNKRTRFVSAVGTTGSSPSTVTDVEMNMKTGR